eukprot:6195551-Pleurochrysis_carterae.AAC.2
MQRHMGGNRMEGIVWRESTAKRNKGIRSLGRAKRWRLLTLASTTAQSHLKSHRLVFDPYLVLLVGCLDESSAARRRDRALLHRSDTGKSATHPGGTPSI